MAELMRKELKYVIGIEQYLRMRKKLDLLMGHYVYNQPAKSLRTKAI